MINQSAIKQLQKQIAKKLLADLADQVLEEAKKLAKSRLNSDTGVYLSSFYVRKSGDAYVVGNDAEQSLILELGSKPHVIEGDPLAFSVGGFSVFVDRVDHPGTKAYNVISDAVDNVFRRRF